MAFEFDRERLQAALLCPNLSQPRLIKSIVRLSELFTVDRDELKNYAQSEELVSAYAMFYLPTNIPKFRFIMQLLPAMHREAIKECHFLDIGTGPGTYILAFLQFAGEARKGKILGLDQSPLMLKQADQLIKNFFPEALDISLAKSIPEKKWPGNSILFFGHGLNEMGLANALALIDRWNPRYLFFLEPGTKALFPLFLSLRRDLRQRGFSVLFPCANNERECPMQNTPGNWCHQIMRTTHHPDIERLSQMAQLDRRTMPMMAHVYVNDGRDREILTEGWETGRIVRVFPETKFSYEFEVCLEVDAGVLNLERLQVFKRNLTREKEKELKSMTSGMSLKFKRQKEIGDSHWRVELLQD